MILLEVGARLVIGHRGASADFPENTMLAFEQALVQGADALELDVRVTRDDAVIVIHDAVLDRTTDASGPVAGRTVAELAGIDAGRGERIPRLDDVLEHFPDTPLIVEVKATGAAAATAACLERHGARDRVVVGSFESQALDPFRRRGFHRASSKAETATAFVWSRIGQPGPGGYHAFTVPETHGRLRVVDPRFVRAARRAGRPVHVWTVDDPERAEYLWSIGVSGIITNAPGTMRALRGERPEGA